MTTVIIIANILPGNQLVATASIYNTSSGKKCNKLASNIIGSRFLWKMSIYGAVGETVKLLTFSVPCLIIKGLVSCVMPEAVL